MEATLTSKGQVTVPKAIRRQLRLHAGDRLEFFMREGGSVQMVPKKTPMRELKGMAPPPVSGVTLRDMEEAIAKGASGDAGC